MSRFNQPSLVMLVALLIGCIPPSQSSTTPASPEEVWVNVFPFGLRTFGLWADVGDSEKLYAATRDGLYVRESEDRYWRPLFPVKADWLTLAQSPADADRLLVGLTARRAGKLLLSQDGGRAWDQVGAEVISEPINQILIDPESADVIYALSGGSLFKTLNGGRSWGDVTPSVSVGEDRVGPPIRFFTVDPSDYAHLIAGGLRTTGHFSRGVSNLAESFDGGLTWMPKDFEGSVVSADTREEVAHRDWSYLTFGDAPHQLVGLLRSGGVRPLLVSEDAGKSWTLNKLGGVKSFAWPPGEAQPIYVAGDWGISSSEDGGKTWQELLPDYTYSLLETEANTLFASTWRGVLKAGASTDAWELASLGLPVELFRAAFSRSGSWFAKYLAGEEAGLALLGCVDGGDRILVGGRNGYWVTSDSGLSWERRNLDLVGNVRQIECPQGGLVYINVAEKQLLGGNSTVLKVLPSGAVQKIKLDKSPRLLATSSQDPNIIFLTAQEESTAAPLQPDSGELLLRSEDAGFSWEAIDLNKWLREEVSGSKIVAIPDVLVARQSADVACLSLKLYHSASGERPVALLLTRDSGRSWSNVYSGIEPIIEAEGQRAKRGELTSISFGKEDGSIIYVVIGDRLLRSGDWGSTWSRVPTTGVTALDESSIRDVAVRNREAEVVYLSTEREVWRTTDRGKSWHRLAEGLHDSSLRQIVVVEDLILLQGASGIYRLSKEDLAWAR